MSDVSMVQPFAAAIANTILREDLCMVLSCLVLAFYHGGYCRTLQAGLFVSGSVGLREILAAVWTIVSGSSLLYNVFT